MTRAIPSGSVHADMERKVQVQEEVAFQIPRLVGLLGRSGSGKDRFYWTELAPLGYIRLALADPVRVLASILLVRAYPGLLENTDQLLRVFPGIYKEVFFPEKSDLSRSLQQYVGTDLARSFRQDYWVDIFRDIALHYLSLGARVAVTDVRFPNEAKVVRDLGGVLVKVPGSGRYEEGNPLSRHPSEEGIEGLPYDMDTETFVRYVLRPYAGERKYGSEG